MVIRAMIICEYGFNNPDKEKPEYSFREVDFYGHIPYKYQIETKNHRLSLRKNLKTGEFELYRYYHHDRSEKVIYSGNLADALAWAFKEKRRFWGELGNIEPDVPCKHKPPVIDDWFCPYKNRGRDEKCRF
ncbi:MAG: hypothetical protein QXJ45_06760 [Thermoproteota archaeon]